MGYFRFHGMLLTGQDEKVDEAHAQALKLFEPVQVTPVLESPMNGWRSFAILPDGSKEGWKPSDRGDEKWVSVQYGDDDLETLIESHSDEERADA